MTPHTLSFHKETQKVIRSIDKDIYVYAFLPEIQLTNTKSKAIASIELYRIAEDVKIILEKLKSINPRIQLKFLNADLADYDSQEFPNVQNGTIFFRTYKQDFSKDLENQKAYIEQSVALRNERQLKEFESRILKALIRVSAPKRKIYFTAMNNERYDWNDTLYKRWSLETLKEQLRFYNISVHSLSYADKWPEVFPTDADALYLIGPRVPLAQQAREHILNYISEGGKVFVAIDPFGKEDFSWLLNALGTENESKYLFKKSLLNNTRLAIRTS